jgi:hypothetical protein
MTRKFMTRDYRIVRSRETVVQNVLIGAADATGAGLYDYTSIIHGWAGNFDDLDGVVFAYLNRTYFSAKHLNLPLELVGLVPAY